MASESRNLGHSPRETGQKALRLGEVIASFMARLDPEVFLGEVGIVVAIINFDSSISQQEALETQGFTCETLEAFSVQDARRLTVLLVGFPCAEEYSHALRPMFPGPSGWFSFEAVGLGEVIRTLYWNWEIGGL